MIPAYPDMISNLGLCDANQKAVIADYCNRTVSYIQRGQMFEAFSVWDAFLNGDVWPYGNCTARQRPELCSLSSRALSLRVLSLSLALRPPDVGLRSRHCIHALAPALANRR
jgi:hypothetical protein